MSDIQTTEERELIAKWNAGDYTAEGWVNNTGGLTEEALNGLAEYNTRKNFNTDNLDEEALLGGSDVNVASLLQNLSPAAIADANMSVTTGKVNNVPAVIADVICNFAPGFARFRAVFERQGSAGTGRSTGQVRWEIGGVSGTIGPSVLHSDPPRPRRHVVLSALASGIPPTARLQFTGPSGILTFTTMFRGTGGYTA